MPHTETQRHKGHKEKAGYSGKAGNHKGCPYKFKVVALDDNTDSKNVSFRRGYSRNALRYFPLLQSVHQPMAYDVERGSAPPMRVPVS